MTNTESRIPVRLEELARWDDAPAPENHEQQITEADIRELEAYAFDSDNHTLVGLGLRELEGYGLDSDNHTLVGLGLRELEGYGLDGDDQTLVGLGPTERARAREAAQMPGGQRMPQSEAPGPFIADDEEMPRSLRGRKLRLWPFLVPAAVLAALAAVAVVRGLAPHAPPALAADAPATAGLAVQLDGSSPRVLVDGEDRGTPPLRLLGLKPGAHVVSITDPAYALYSQSVMLTANQVVTLEPTLTFVRGVIRLSAGDGADDAEVQVVGANERREIQRLPARLEVAPGEYRIRGSRRGYAPFEHTAVLSAASPEVEVSIALAREGTAGGPPNALKAADGTAAGVGSLDITSNPPSNVVLDGRPLGKAPRVVQTPPGPHTVVFINPEYGRMSLSVNVSAGQTTSASADF